MEGTIPVADGTVLQITVYRQNGDRGKLDPDCSDRYGCRSEGGDQTDRQPAGRGGSDAGRCRCSKNGQKQRLKALGEEEKEQVTNIGRLEELEARLEELETAQEEEREKETPGASEKDRSDPDACADFRPESGKPVSTETG